MEDRTGFRVQGSGMRVEGSAEGAEVARRRSGFGALCFRVEGSRLSGDGNTRVAIAECNVSRGEGAGHTVCSGLKIEGLRSFMRRSLARSALCLQFEV